MRLTILYRGPLSSCNYDCAYCPFSKRVDTQQQLIADEQMLARFVDWCASSEIEDLRIFFTPWGEALTRRWYWTAFEQLTSLPNVSKVAVQTNLSASLDWLSRCEVHKAGLWCTYHPSQVARERFLQQVLVLDQMQVKHSVGMVGLKEDFEEIEAVRHLLPDTTYMWVNAYKRQADYYSSDDIARLTRVDPLFSINNTRHASRGEACRCGESVISVDGDGAIRRCHFVKQILGNLYDDNLASLLRPTPCPLDTCGCYIGYVHMRRLKLYPVYGDTVIERIPADAESFPLS